MLVRGSCCSLAYAGGGVLEKSTASSSSLLLRSLISAQAPRVGGWDGCSAAGAGPARALGLLVDEIEKPVD